MQAQRAMLFKQISREGWKISKVDDWELDWWADEMWVLESSWSPVGGRAYLTFLVDPQIPHSLTRRKDEAIWAVEVSPSRMRNRLSIEDSFVMRLNQGWQVELPALLEHFSQLRNDSRS